MASLTNLIMVQTFRRTALWVFALALTLAGAGLADPPSPDPKPHVFLGGIVDTAKSDSAESTAGDLIADAARETAHADIALLPADEIAADAQIAAGNHASEELLALLRYAGDDTDDIVVLDLTGRQILDAAERSVSRVPGAFDGFLQISGLQIRFDASKPGGRRVMEAALPGAAISADKHYAVATTRPIANGGFGYFRIWDKSAITADTHVTLAQSIVNYAARHPALSPNLDGRIIGL